MSGLGFRCPNCLCNALHDTIQHSVCVKRFNDYETSSGLFRASQKDALKLTVAEQIWLIIAEPIYKLSEILDIDVIEKNYAPKIRILQNT